MTDLLLGVGQIVGGWLVVGLVMAALYALWNKHKPLA